VVTATGDSGGVDGAVGAAAVEDPNVDVQA
jgi:hypothetical protein